MNVADPINCVIPSLDGPVLEVLAGSAVVLSLTEIHRRSTRGTLNGVRKVLLRLVREGVVLAEPGGYQFNRQHVAADAVESLVNMRSLVIARIRAEVSSWSYQAELVGIFGSFARRDGNASSDIDIIVIGEDRCADELLDDLALRVVQWTGNRAQIMALSRPDLQRLQVAHAVILDELRRDLEVVHGNVAVLAAPK